LLEGLSEHVRPVLLTNGHFASRLDLLQAILFDLGLPFENATEQTARLAIVESCLSQYCNGGTTLIVADEAHLLSADLLDELRQLGNLDGKDGKAVQVALVGLGEIEKTLADPALAILRQRLATRATIEPMVPEEAADYLNHQVRVCGGKPERFFGEDVLDILSHATGGVPRIVNRAATLAMQLSSENGVDYIDTEAAVEAVTQLGLDRVDDEDQSSVETDVEPVRSKMPEILLTPHAVNQKSLPEPKYDPVETPLTPLRVTRATLPFPPVILPIDEGPPTFIYGDDPGDGPEIIGPRPGGLREPWKAPTDQVG
jgi:type II secretory pathway predicted ATPase ExeA